MFVFFFKQKTAYEMRISDWSSDVCSSDLRDEWAHEITYRAEIGVMFKDTLSISPDGISWKGQSFSLDSITRVRWGGVRHSVNGVPTGTTYTIAFGDKRSEEIGRAHV